MLTFRAAGLAALAFGWQFWKAVTRRDDDEEVQVADPRFEESQRPGRYPCIEHELASFRGGDSDEIDLPGSSEVSSSSLVSSLATGSPSRLARQGTGSSAAPSPEPVSKLRSTSGQLVEQKQAQAGGSPIKQPEASIAQSRDPGHLHAAAKRSSSAEPSKPADSPKRKATSGSASGSGQKAAQPVARSASPQAQPTAPSAAAADNTGTADKATGSSHDGNVALQGPASASPSRMAANNMPSPPTAAPQPQPAVASAAVPSSNSSAKERVQPEHDAAQPGPGQAAAVTNLSGTSAAVEGAQAAAAKPTAAVAIPKAGHHAELDTLTGTVKSRAPVCEQVDTTADKQPSSRAADKSILSRGAGTGSETASTPLPDSTAAAAVSVAAPLDKAPAPVSHPSSGTLATALLQAASSQAPVPAPSSAADADTSDTPLGQPSRLVSDADESGPVQRSGTEESEQPIASPSSDQLSSSAWGVTSESSHRRTDSSSSNVSKALATPTHQHQRLPSFPEIDYEPGSDPANEDHKRTPSFPTIDYEPATASDSVFVQMHPFPENAVFSEGASLSENELGMSRVPSSSSKRRGRPKPLQTTITASSKQLQEATEEVSTPVNRLMAAASRSWSEPNLAGRDQPANLLEGQPAFYGTIHADFRQGVGYADSEASEEASPPPKGSRREVNGSIAAERAASLKRTRADTDAEVPQALKLDVLSGPRQDLSYTTQLGTTQVTIGRLDGNTLVIKDNEVSGNHTLIRWDAKERCWEVTDVGSLNGTVLNGRTISTSNRRRGRNYRLSSDDILQLGSATRIKVSYCPVELPLNDLPLPPKRLHTPSSIWQNVTALDGSAASTGAPEEPASHAAPAPPAAMPSRPPTHPPAATSFQQASLRLSGCVVSKTGREHQRKGQGCEDVPFWQCPVPGTTNVGLFCVFDGHCGRATAEEVRDILPKQLAERLPSVTADMAAGRGADSIWEDTFLTTDAALTSEEGCTATALLAWQDAGGQVCLQTANVGDSAGVFSDLQQQRCFQMTADHRLTNPVERQRLKDMGINMGSGRTRLYGLNLSRCLGDKFLKDEDLGLSAQPHVSQVVKVGSSETAFVMLASDGLWDVTDSQHAVQVALRAHQESDGSVQAMAEAVVQHAQRQRTKDDVTVLLVKIGAAVEAASSGQGALKPHE